MFFSHKFNQSIDNVIFNDCLESLNFGEEFNKPIDNVNFSINLKKICFGSEFNQSVDNITFPVSLEEISFGKKFSQSINNLPNSLLKLTLNTLTCTLFNLPLNLKDIYIYHIKENETVKKIEYSDRKHVLSKIKVPFGCKVSDSFSFIYKN